LYINLIWNETGVQTGLSKILKSGKSVLVNFYNPGSKGNYQIRLKAPPQELNIVSVSNSAVVGDVICANLRDT